MGLADKNLLNIKDILDFANTCDIEDVKPMLDPQIQCNTAISEEGLLGNYGANIGSVLLKTYGSDIKKRAVAKAAAGSDARMNGCELPVVINSGSGNQGITVSVPVIEYAKELNVSKEKLYRALVLSNLIAIHEKDRHRPAVRLLRGRQRRVRRRLRHRLSPRRRVRSHFPHPGELPGYRVRDHLRRSQGSCAAKIASSWKPGSWAIPCTRAATSSRAGTAS